MCLGMFRCQCGKTGNYMPVILFPDEHPRLECCEEAERTGGKP
jgi:hypothetical protein